MTKIYNIGIVILNYNDADTTIELYNKIKGYTCINHIVIVDNCSSDNSWERLKNNCTCDLLKAEANNGYSAGNNLGARHLINRYACRYLIIANPDVIFSENFIISVIEKMEEYPEFGIMSGVMLDKEGQVVRAAYGFTPLYYQAILECFYLYRYYVMHVKATRIDYDKIIMPVEVVWGSLFAISAEAYLRMNGFDEGTFLYHEENIIARRIQGIGLSEGILTTEKYWHMHGISTGKQTNRMIRHVLGLKSMFYFQSKYNNLNRFQKRVLSVFMKYSKLEMQIINHCLALLGK